MKKRWKSMSTRLEKVEKLVKEHHLSALIIDNPIDLYYLCGQKLSLGRLVVEELGATLFVDGRYFEACKDHLPFPVILTTHFGKESTFAKGWKFGGKKVGFDATYTTVSDFEQLQSLGCELIPLKGPIKQIREIKEEGEIALLKRAAELGSQGFDYVCTLLKEGVTEKEIARELELFWLKAGGEGLAFSPHIGFGDTTSQPHYSPTDRSLKKGEIVLIDIGVVYGHYHSDMTRVVAYGKPPAELQKIYQIVYKAFIAAATLCRPGVTIGDVDRSARDWIAKQGYQDYFPHSLGHGVGLEIHERPSIRSTGPDADRPLQRGMVMTIEPGIYLPGVGGVRLEDTLVITERGHENITGRPLSPTLPNIALL
jgi:Xaa-Pro aminopeptidase